MHDVIVIGTGPGGSLAALRLAEAGAKVLVLEKARLPRDKACGGALTVGPVQALLGWDFSDMIEARVENSRWQVDFGPSHYGAHDYGAWMINRRSFDLHILERALASGAELRDGFAVEAVVEDAEGVTVTGKSGEQCRARFLVGADGAAGRTAAALGLGRRSRPAVAIDSEIEVTPEVWEQEGGRMSFNFGAALGGYGWVFPKKGYLSCGVGSWTRSGGMPGQLDAYLARALPAGAIVSQQRRGHPIPIYEGPAPISTRRAVLVGDAASLVEPILGEGIRFALASGAVAAEVLAEALVDGPPHPLAYSARVHDRIGAHLDRLRRFILPIFLKSPQTFFDNFVSGDESYRALSVALERRFPSPDPFATARSAQS